MNEERYSRQELFSEIGREGQELIQEGSVLIIGCGALGTLLANNLVRAGVGRIRIVDRDFVELDNLQRQALFDEEDVRRRLPKAVAAMEKLKKINSTIRIESEVLDVNHRNIEALITPVDLVLDATDNMETRFLINDACIKNMVPWIYGGAVASYGMTMNIIPGKSACLRCIIEKVLPPGTTPTCDMVGVLNSVPAIIASIQSTEALKILMGRCVPDNGLIYIDVWQRRFSQLHLKRQPNCPTCVQMEFDFLHGKGLSETFSLCGRNAVQINPPSNNEINLEKLKESLITVGKVYYNGYFLSFKIDQYELIVFPEGRTMVKGTTDESIARSLYAKYVGG